MKRNIDLFSRKKNLKSAAFIQKAFFQVFYTFVLKKETHEEEKNVLWKLSHCAAIWISDACCLDGPLPESQVFCSLQHSFFFSNPSSHNVWLTSMCLLNKIIPSALWSEYCSIISTHVIKIIKYSIFCKKERKKIEMDVAFVMRCKIIQE